MSLSLGCPLQKGHSPEKNRPWEVMGSDLTPVALQSVLWLLQLKRLFLRAAQELGSYSWLKESPWVLLWPGCSSSLMEQTFLHIASSELPLEAPNE